MTISGNRAFDPNKSVYSLGECAVTFGPNTPFLKAPFEIRCLSGTMDLEAERIVLKHPATLIVDGKEFSTLDPKGSIIVEKGKYEIAGDTYSIKKKRR